MRQRWERVPALLALFAVLGVGGGTPPTHAAQRRVGAGALPAAQPKCVRQVSKEPLQWRWAKTAIRFKDGHTARSKAVDFDQDGDLDVLVHLVSFYEYSGEGYKAKLTAWENDGTGRFREARKQEWLVGRLGRVDQMSNEPPLLGDFNGDGVPDLYYYQTGWDGEGGCGDPERECPGAPNLLLLSQPDGRYRSSLGDPYPGHSQSFTHHAAAADVDGDRDLDIWDATWGGKVPGIRLLINDGNGAFRAENDRLPGGSGGLCAENGLADCFAPKVAFCDVDGDGDPDLVGSPLAVSHGGYGRATVLKNQGGGYFESPVQLLPVTANGTESTYGGAPVCSDLDLDGDPDLLIATVDGFVHTFRGRPHLAFLQNRGKGRFKDVTKKRLPQSLGPDGGSDSMSVVDLNNDGWPDIVLPLSHTSSRVFMNRGRGRFKEIVLPHFPPDIWIDITGYITPMDADGDGRIDLFVHDEHVEQRGWILFNETKVKEKKRKRRPCR